MLQGAHPCGRIIVELQPPLMPHIVRVLTINAHIAHWLAHKRGVCTLEEALQLQQDVAVVSKQQNFLVTDRI